MDAIDSSNERFDEVEALVVVPQKLESPRSTAAQLLGTTKRDLAIYASIVVVGWLLIFTRTSQLFQRTEELVPIDFDPANTTSWYYKDRSIQRLGSTDEYVEINKGSIEKRIEDMRLLDQVRFGHCGRFEDFLAGDNTTNWIKHPERGRAQHCKNGAARRKEICAKKWKFDRYVCETEHPTLQDVTVTIERMGRFYGTGGYDWTSTYTIYDVGNLKESTRGHDLAFVGGMAAPIYPNGTLVGYPPLHIHHAHVFPYGDMDERKQKINGSVADYHHVLFQSHGDTECHSNEGGRACLLSVLDPGMGRVIEKSESGLSANFEINDVRPRGSGRMEYWFEIVVMLTPYDKSRIKRNTFVGLNNQCIGEGPCTYAIPFDPNSNLLSYNYTHGDSGSKLSSGFMSNFILHTHQTLMDSAFLFLSSDNSVFEAIDSFRQDREYPLILDCLDEEPYDIETAKKELFNKILDAGGKLVCEATRPSLHLQVDNAGIEHGYDKRARMNCLQGQVPLNVGDVLTVLAFNEIHPHNITRRSPAFLEQNVFENGFAVNQHSVFRFELSYGNEEPAYVPPSYFYYSDGWEKEESNVTLDELLHTGCPDSIRYGSSQ